MGNQTSIITESTRAAAVQNTTNYAASVAKHISGDWGQHNQIAVYDQAFTNLSKAVGARYSNHNISYAKCLRLLVTIEGTDYAVIVPAIYLGPFSGGGSDAGSPGATAPAFSLNPVSAELTAGSPYTLSISFTGTAPVLLQWVKDGKAISGANGTSYAISSFQPADAGNYACVAVNSVGQAVSAVAVLSERVTSTPSVPTRPGIGGGCFSRNTLVTLANGVQQPITALRPGDVLRSYAIGGLNPDVEESWKTFAEPFLEASPAVSTVREVLVNSFDYYYEINGQLEVTYEHPLLVKKSSSTHWRFLRVQDIKVGDYLFRNGSAALVKTMTRVNTPIQTWNIDVEPYDIYIANGYVAHNITYK